MNTDDETRPDATRGLELSKRRGKYGRLLISSLLLAIAFFLLLIPVHTAFGLVNHSTRDFTGHTDNIFASGRRSPLFQGTVDLSITKSHTGNFQIGTSGTYIITVSNVGASQVNSQVTVTDVLPNGLVPTQASGSGWTPCGFSGQTVVCTHPNTGGLAPGTSLPQITIVVTVGQAAAPSVTNAATLANADDTNSANNTASDPTSVVSADLAVTKSVAPTVVAELAPITYTVSIRNDGPSNTTGVVLTDTLPAGLTFIGASATRGTYSSSSGLWAVGNLVNGESVSLTITALLGANTRGQTIVNTARGLKSDLYDYHPADNQASASVRVRSTRLIGIVTSFQTNQPVVSASLVFTDSLTHVYTTTSASSGWYTFTESASTPVSAGAFTIKASKSGYRPTTISSSLTANIDNRQDIPLNTADLVVAKKTNVTSVVPGQTLTYTLAITNVGTIPASQIIITDVLPTNLTYITDTLGINHTTPSTGNIVWKPSASLNPNSVIRFQLRVQVATALTGSSTSIVNTLKASTSSPEATLTNNSVQATVTATGSPTINITKSVGSSQVRTAQNATYTIVVNNTGTAPVTSVSLVDYISSYVDIVSTTTTQGTATTNSTTRTVTVNIGTLNPGTTVTITIIVRVNTLATSNIYVYNYATVTYTFGGTTYTRTSNTTNFYLVYSSTLPTTGGIEPEPREADLPPRASLPAYLSGLLLAILGIGAIVYGTVAKRRNLDWAGWVLRMGILFSVAALLFGLVGWGLQTIVIDKNRIAVAGETTQPVTDANNELSEPTEAEIIMPPSQVDTVEKLPDFPVPTPTVPASSNPGEKPPDTTEITRIILPSLGVDTVVKYVPFDGNTWKIAGLKQEVAWLGDTSWPGLGSNTALAGHVTLRTGEDGPFRHLDQLQPNDEVTLFTEQAIYTYKVRDKQSVDETDLSVVKSTDTSQLTLITCTNWNSQIKYYIQRLVVVADLLDVKPIPGAKQSN
jgi:LPXTG-site transpeptidase (sortase) family protein